MKGARLALVFSLVALAASFAPASGQPQSAPKGPPFAWPERMKNAQVLPADTSPDQLRDAMRHFASSLGVRCTFCHVGPEGAPLTQLDFVSDVNPHKQAARGMMRMTDRLNDDILSSIPGLHEPRVTCFTCHRGAARPATEPPASGQTPTQPPAAPPAILPQHVNGERGAH